ncbi:OmpA family protein [Flavobacterium sp.]|uniref:OmpA family protein n=1 Tax=Flavobacterium sp. TaxID=239 RepID=UPI003D1150AF
MRKIIYFFVLWLSVQSICAQEGDMERANRFFERTYYSEAIPLYEKIVKENTSKEVVRNLADAYFYTNDLKSAQRYYRFFIKNFGKELDEEYYFRFSQTLKATSSFAEANEVMLNFYKNKGDQAIADKYTRDLVILENVTAIGERYSLQNLEINTDKSEFGGVVFGNHLIYAGAKSNPNALDKKYKWNNETYLNLLSIPIANSDKKDSLAVDFSSELNSVMHEASAVFTTDGKTVYFTRNFTKPSGKRAKNEKKVSVLYIYQAELVNGKWANIKALPFNNPNYSIAHPALSPDGRKMYFSSDMPGGFGSYDLYEIDYNEGAWGDPKNLGPSINTSRREQFPFLANDNKLYFSSNGHLGFGSLDVFVSEVTKNGFTQPVNVGLPLNSGTDDFAFYINSDTQKGYFSSNRKGGKGSDDIYAITQLKPLVVEDCMQYIAGVVTDESTKLPLDKAKVTLIDAYTSVVVDSVEVSESGKYNFKVPCEKGFKIKASKADYNEIEKSIFLQKERNKINSVDFALKTLAKINEENLIAQQNKAKAEAEAQQLALEKEKQLADAKLKENELKKKARVKELLKNEKDVVEEQDKLLIKTEPIYFDYDLWYIRRESKPVLDKVIAMMNKYPDMKVEIGSHTDIRGGRTYNLILSENRARATRGYFIDKGIDPNRISSKGYGESQPIIKCTTEESCNEEQHELNRRSEFVIKDL